MLNENFQSNGNEHHAAAELCLGLKAVAEHIADLYAHSGTYEGGCANQQDRRDNGNIQECKGYAYRQGIDPIK